MLICPSAGTVTAVLDDKLAISFDAGNISIPTVVRPACPLRPEAGERAPGS